MENEQQGQQPCAAVSYGSDFAKAVEYYRLTQQQQQPQCPYVLKSVPPVLLQTKKEAYETHFVSLGRERLRTFRFLEDGLKCDVVMLENQLPLQALDLVYQVVRETPILKNNPLPASLRDLAMNTLPQLSPFICHRSLPPNPHESAMISVREIIESTSNEAHHLLDMLYSAIAEVVGVDPARDIGAGCGFYMDEVVAAPLRFIGVKHPAETDNHFKNKYNASALKRAGITFRHSESNTNTSTRAFKGIGFERSSSTLVLPAICMSQNYTEVLLRNLMALEFSDDSDAPTPMTEYVHLMDCLIDSAEDVAVLRNAQVLRRDSMMLHDEQVAKMWDDLSRHRGCVEPSTALKDILNEALIRNYYKSCIRGWWREFHDTYLSRPWTFVALLVATILLFAELVQTYCAFGSACTPAVANHKEP